LTEEEGTGQAAEEEEEIESFTSENFEEDINKEKEEESEKKEEAVAAPEAAPEAVEAGKKKDATNSIAHFKNKNYFPPTLTDCFLCSFCQI
jgi:hypothetical protein